MPENKARETRADLRKVATCLSHLTGVAAAEILGKTRGHEISEPVRHLTLDFCRCADELGFSQAEVARAIGRHRSTVANAPRKGAALRHDFPSSPDVAALMDILRRHWRADAPPPYAKRRAAAYQRAWREHKARAGGRRLEPAAHAACLAAAAIAVTAPVRAAPRSSTSVPEIDEPDLLAPLRRAPALREVVPSLTWERAGETGYFVSFVARSRDKAAELLRRSVRALSDLGWASEQRSIVWAPDGFRAVLKAGAAALVALACGILTTDLPAPITGRLEARA